MKTKIKRHSRSVISVLLAVCMLISCMTVGIIATDAAQDASEGVGENNSFTKGDTIYVDIGSTWYEKYPNTSVPYAFFSYSSSDANNSSFQFDRQALTQVSGSIFSITVPDRDYMRVIRIQRCNASDTSTVWDSVTTSKDAAGSNDLFTISSWHDDGGWSTYTPPANTHSVTISNSITHGTVTTDAASVAEGSTTTIRITPEPGYELTSISATGTGSSLTGSGNTRTLTMGTADVTIDATFSAADNPTTTLTTTFYVDKDKVNGLYVWTDSGAEPLGTWSETDSNVSSITTIERPTGYNSGSYVKLTFNSSDSTFKYIVKKGTDKSADSASYPIGGTYVIGSITNVPTVLGGGGGGSNTDAKWDAIFIDANKVPAADRNKYLLKSNNQVPNNTNFTSTGLDAYVSDGKIYFKIPYATVSAYKYFMLVGTDNNYTTDWYQITDNNGNSITDVSVDTSASEYLTAYKRDYNGQEDPHRNTKYYYSQVNIKEGAENTFSNVVLEIDPAQSKRTFTYYTYGATPIAKMPKVVVENGSYGYQSKYGTATVSTPSGLTGTAGTWWTTYRVEEGTQLYITTTIGNSYRGDGTDSGMYVAAYAVNGVKYDVEQSGNTYTFVNTKPITVGTEDIEITPIYYSRTIENNDDYITIYVEADSDLIDHWGDQIYVYSYYYITGQTEGRIDGNYPGQTLALDASGYYVGKIAKYNYTGDYLQTKDENHPVSGVTFSGGYENNAPHHNFIDYAQNRQTYDYDDFIVNEIKNYVIGSLKATKAT